MMELETTSLYTAHDQGLDLEAYPNHSIITSTSHALNKEKKNSNETDTYPFSPFSQEDIPVLRWDEK